MRTKWMILGIVGGIAIICAAILAALMIWLGLWAGLAAGLAIAAMILLLYGVVFEPWARRWGATEAEVAAVMPGDELVSDSTAVTRAITIEAAPRQVWPWLVQIGWGRAGWYSYDWLDNDGKPSADRIIPELQNLQVDDRIPMIPGMGPPVRRIEPNALLVAGDIATAMTWCLMLTPVGPGGTRLITRWRLPKSRNVFMLIWSLFFVPGHFLLERKMLKNLKTRAAQENR
ncbi:hypothetical protein [Nonomuraea sp. NPDC049480]|uniref:hypothetical protein n=1 Tax=Nonomuraea sp. NPDC049480 TaxID=3364353 RepID=UPI0037933C63